MGKRERLGDGAGGRKPWAFATNEAVPADGGKFSSDLGRRDSQ